MKIIFCGPPHSGKTVLIHNLEANLPTDSFMTMRIHKDGEGNWSNNPDQEQIRAVRRKGDYDEDFINKKCAELKQREEHIVLVDIGGRLLDDKIPIFEVCDSFVVISNDTEKKKQWIEFGEKHGCTCIAAFDSILDGEDCIFNRASPLKGRLSKLERGTDKTKSPVITELADLIIRKSGFFCNAHNDNIHYNTIDFVAIARELGCGWNVGADVMNGFHVNFTPDKAPLLYRKISGFAKEHGFESYEFYNSRSNWVTMISALSLVDSGVGDIRLYDVGMNDYVKIRRLNKKADIGSPSVLEYSVLEGEHELFINAKTKKDSITLDDFNSIMIPQIDESKTLYFSGRIPNWLTASIFISYPCREMYLLQPGNGFFCCKSEDKNRLGKQVKNPDGMDISRYLLKISCPKNG